MNGLVLALRAEKWISKGCEAYLAFMIVEAQKKQRLEDVLVVREFIDVFLEDHLGLPYEREVEFVIDAHSRVNPISIPLYCMAAAKLKELEAQLRGVT